MLIHYKSLIAPFIAVLAVTLQLVFGLEINQEIQGQIVEAIANMVVVVMLVYGIVHNHFRN